MVSAIGSSSSFRSASGGSSTAGLEAQLARYQKILSECVSCSSAKTREGQVAIQEVACKIGEIKARIENISNAQLNSQPNIPANAAVTAPSPSGPATSVLGNRLDIFA